MKVRRTALNVIMVCLALIVVISGYKIFTILREYKVNQAKYKEISEIASPNGFTGDIDFDKLAKVNPDVVGWLYYEGTVIDYPIVKGTDNDKYLYTSFDGSYGGCGTLFVDCVTEKPFEQFNTIVYGHHMKDGSMFNCLQKLKDPEYCKENPRLELITPKGKYHLEICAFLNQPSDSSIYTTNIEDSEQKNTYLDSMRGMADYTTDVPFDEDDRLVMLSTCAYEFENARYIVVCKMVPWE
ncbi:MAG: class B sortase [Mogibacterium sp.]|nr:class B sortase [Mogibacterium sp.]